MLKELLMPERFYHPWRVDGMRVKELAARHNGGIEPGNWVVEWFSKNAVVTPNGLGRLALFEDKPHHADFWTTSSRMNRGLEKETWFFLLTALNVSSGNLPVKNRKPEACLATDGLFAKEALLSFPSRQRREIEEDEGPAIRAGSTVFFVPYDDFGSWGGIPRRIVDSVIEGNPVFEEILTYSRFRLFGSTGLGVPPDLVTTNLFLTELIGASKEWKI